MSEQASKNKQGTPAYRGMALENSELAEASKSHPHVHSWIIVLLGAVVGLLIAIFWVPAIADDTIGVNLASSILGTNAALVRLTGGWFSLAFAIAVGLGNTFTACNCAVFSCIAPLSGQKRQTKAGVWYQLAFIATGVIVVTILYGIIGVLLNQQIPSLSNATLSIGRGFPVRLVQSTTVFVILGIVLFYWGLVTLRLVRNPLAKLVEQHLWTIPLSLGVIVGCFSIGRPYPLFQILFHYVAGSGNILVSAILMGLQGLCNIVVMALLFVLLMFGTGGRVERWMQESPLRMQAITAFSVIGAGVFLIAYWGMRLPAQLGIGWFPHL